MANSIAYTESYLKLLDAIYKKGSASAILEAGAGKFRTDNINSKVVYLKTIAMDGLGSYSRATGYVGGDVDVSWTPYTFTVERGRKFNLDTMDAVEAQTTVLEIMAELMRTKIVPELDAYRFSKIKSLCGFDVSANLTYDTVIAAIKLAIRTLDDAEVPAESRVLFVSNEVYDLMGQSGEFMNVRTVDANNGVISTAITSFEGMPIIKVPNARFFSAYDFADGSTQGQEAGGFSAAAGSKALNFICADRNAITAIIKHQAPKLISPDNNADADGYVFGMRLYHDLWIPTNSLPGVYVHSKQ